MKKKIFGIALLGVLSTLSAGVISQNGIAKDSATGLMWQDNDSVSNTKVDWYEAKDVCTNLKLGNYADWRVPNRFELATLINSTKQNGLYVIDGFKAPPRELGHEGYLWSSDSCEHDNRKGWLLFIDDDYVGDTFKSYEGSKASVRCVRGNKLTFSLLQKLKNSGKLKVPQKSIDELSPTGQEKLNKQTEEFQKEQSQRKSVTTRSYNSWEVKYKYQTGGSIPSESSMIKCSNGKESFANYFYDSKLYIVDGGSMFKTLDEAANHICGNR